MALLARAILTEFRNYARVAFVPGPALNVITGPNGSGKTSLLEAISLLGPGRGLRGARADQLARHGGSGRWAVAATVTEADGTPRALGTGLPADNVDAGDTGAVPRRVFRLDGSPASSALAFAVLPLVWLTPQMERLFGDAPSARRRFLDRLVAVLEPAHARALAAHETAVANRNRLLSDGRHDRRWLAAAEDAVARHAVAVTASRLALCDQLNEAAAEALQPFPAATVRLQDPVGERLATEPARLTEDWLRDVLARDRPTDAASGATRIGAHRADVLMSDRSTGRPAALGSTGEQKALLLGVVLAHATLLAADRGVRPLLLLDEPLVHLDAGRRAALLERLARSGGQVVLTGTDAAPFAPVGDASAFFETGNDTVEPAPARARAGFEGASGL